MKRFFSLILAAIMLLLVGLPLIPTVSAEETPETPVNFAASLIWNKSVGSPSVTKTETGAVMKNLANSWDSVGVDILPALKEAMGSGNSVSLKLTVSLKATMKAGSEKSAVTVRPLIRGTSTKGGLGDAEWNSQYTATMKGDPPLMAMYSGNIMGFMDNQMTLAHDKWYTYETALDLTRNQIGSELLSEWIFCVDNLGGMDLSKVDNIEFKDLTIRIDDGIADDNAKSENNDHLITDYKAEQWSPVEIVLWSTKAYKNPFVETEIDAVFTHADGTKITLPGFWKEGRTWAVRFSPTKVGEWSYKITCSDKDNEGLTKSGKITATESTGDTDLEKLCRRGRCP